MMRKYPVQFGGGPGEKAAMTSLAVYPTSSLAPASSSSSRLAFGSWPVDWEEVIPYGLTA